jgi:GNAT superfamily N-acetyltransferase
MRIETSSIPGPLLAEYAGVPIAFEVTSVMSARRKSDQQFVLTETRLAAPYVKDYDAIADRPVDWAARFDTSRWVLIVARDETRTLGGATIAFQTPGLDMLEGRSDLGVLWDIRVAPAVRGRGIGRALFEAAEAWAVTRGCRELKIETQNVNVAACRFYAALGCELRVVREHAYPQCPGESQILWYKRIDDDLAIAAQRLVDH